jgi:hypothetical protein
MADVQIVSRDKIADRAPLIIFNRHRLAVTGGNVVSLLLGDLRCHALILPRKPPGD